MKRRCETARMSLTRHSGVIAPQGLETLGWISMLCALSGRNHLITRAYGSLLRGETLGQNGRMGRPGAMLRLSPSNDQRHQREQARIVIPWRNWRRNRKRRRALSTAFCVNRGAAAFCSSPFTSGGGIRTRDLRVMSPTSYLTALPRGHYRLLQAIISHGHACVNV